MSSFVTDGTTGMRKLTPAATAGSPAAELEANFAKLATEKADTDDLGTAAYIDVGTGPNQIPQLNGSGEQVGTYILRKGTAAAMASVVLSAGEVGFATDTKDIKVGNGSTAFSSLANSNAVPPVFHDFRVKPAGAYSVSPTVNAVITVSSDGAGVSFSLSVATPVFVGQRLDLSGEIYSLSEFFLILGNGQPVAKTDDGSIYNNADLNVNVVAPEFDAKGFILSAVAVVINGADLKWMIVTQDGFSITLS
jgi:hypothetical protein